MVREAFFMFMTVRQAAPRLVLHLFNVLVQTLLRLFLVDIVAENGPGQGDRLFILRPGEFRLAHVFIGDAELEVVVDVAGIEFDRLLEEFGCLFAAGRGESTVEDLGEGLEDAAEVGDLAVPAGEDVIGDIIAGIELDGGLGLGLDLLGELDLFLAALHEGDAADGDGEGEMGHVVTGAEGHGLAGEFLAGVIIGALGFFAGEFADVDMGARDLPGGDAVGRVGGVGGLVVFQGRGVVETVVGGIALGDGILGGQRQGQQKQAGKQAADFFHVDLRMSG